MVWGSYSGISDLSDHVSEYSEQSITDAALLQLSTESQAYGKDISGYIERAFRVPATLASSLASSSIDSSFNPARLSRAQVSQLVQDSLASTPELSSAYVHFEDNAFDGRDADFVDSDAIYNTAIGSLEVYWLREDNNQLSLQEVEDPNEKYLNELDEFGNRESEWYLCAKDSKQPCLMEPYGYELNGQTLPMTSLVYPILVQERFIGITGVDLNLPEFQRLVDQLSQSLYSGQAKVSLLSQKGLIVASSHYNQHLMRPFAEALDKGKELQQLHKGAGVLIDQGTAYTATAVPVADIGGQWSLVVELPLEVALAELTQFRHTLDSKQTSVLGKQLSMAAVFLLAAIIMVVLLVRSIVQPLSALDTQVAQLASGDGDLSRRLNLDTHAELISLGRHFNEFMEKLRSMILALKDSSESVRLEANNNLSISQQTAHETDNQHNEIHHVVTATQEMSATAQEVSRIASSVSTRTDEIHQTVTNAQQELSSAVNEVLELTDNMQSASGSISEVAQRSDEINNILVVIRGIAEQTNLLALNAAIEAARAGEQGRGFAVVADEVRTLASRTQSSTEEINSMIESLQNEVNKAVAIIAQGTERAANTMQTTQHAHGTLNEVVLGVSEITDNIGQVATAAEEQSSVSDEIAKNLTAIGDAAQTLSELSRQATTSSETVNQHMNTMEQNLNQLRT